MAGTWTDITRIDVPSSAAEGETVDVSVKVKNIHRYSIYIPVTAEADGISMYFSPASPMVNPGETKSYSSSFIMPNKDVLLTVKSWISNYTMELDDTETRSIDLEVIAEIELLDGREITLEPLGIAEIELLDSRVVTLEPLAVVEIELLDSRVVTLTPLAIGVQLLDSRVVTLTPLAIGVQLLDSRIVTLGIVPPPPCTPGETKCIGPDLYQCSLEEEWVLVEKDSPLCVVEEEEKFPWLLVAGGLGVAAVAAAAIAKKKKPAKEKRA